MKAVDYGLRTPTVSAFVSTNSICQGQHVPIIWPIIFREGYEIKFAHTSFKWTNLASHNAGVTVAIVGIGLRTREQKVLFSVSPDGALERKSVHQINAYLVPADNVIVQKSSKPLFGVAEMTFGSKPVDGGNLLLSRSELDQLNLTPDDQSKFTARIVGSDEFINGKMRYCVWVRDQDADVAIHHPKLRSRISAVREMRQKSKKAATQAGAAWPHRFDERRQDGTEQIIVVPAVSSEGRDYLPCGLLQPGTIITNRNFGIFNAPIWNLAIVASRLHWVWVDAVCGKLETRFNYSNTLGWNTFPIPKLTEKNKADLTRCAEDILLAREAHFPATIADLYDPEKMPDDLRAAHERNDEVLERIYIGRRFKNDTERLEKLFELYTKMTSRKEVA